MPQTRAVYQWGVRALIQLTAVWGMAFGLGLIWGGPHRFGGAGFAAAREVPGGCYTWGALMALFGFVTLAGAVTGWHRRVVMSGLMAQGLAYLSFAVALFRAFLDDPGVAITGWLVYSFVAVAHFVLYATGHQLRGLPH